MGQRTSLIMDDPVKFQGIWWEIARYGKNTESLDHRLKYEFIYTEGGYNVGIYPECPNSIPYQQVATIVDNNKLHIDSIDYLILFTDYVNWAFLGNTTNDTLLILSRKDTITYEDRALIMAATDKMGLSSDKLLTFPEVIQNHGITAPKSMQYVLI